MTKVIKIETKNNNNNKASDGKKIKERWKFNSQININISSNLFWVLIFCLTCVVCSNWCEALRILLSFGLAYSCYLSFLPLPLANTSLSPGIEKLSWCCETMAMTVVFKYSTNWKWTNKEESFWINQRSSEMCKQRGENQFHGTQKENEQKLFSSAYSTHTRNTIESTRCSDDVFFYKIHDYLRF